MDRDVVLAKLESLRRCLRRVQDKTPASLDRLVEDCDTQDIVVLNLERAVQLCVDIGLHVISGTEMLVPDTMAMTFEALRRAGVIDEKTAERMVKAVGFRNTAVHAYQAMDWRIVYRILTEHLGDFRDFAAQILRAMAIDTHAASELPCDVVAPDGTSERSLRGDGGGQHEHTAPIGLQEERSAANGDRDAADTSSQS